MPRFSRSRCAASHRTFRFEPLEPRLPLSAAGLVDVGAQPDGGLAGKVVYTHGGHGYVYGNSWGFQRPLLLGMIEDLGNQDQMTFLVDYLFRAGATVAPQRPVGDQPNEVVLDNDDVEVTFTGAWSDSSASIYFGDAGDVPYRFASTSATETAVANYRPNITEAGFYPVYAWTRSGSDRASDQLYRVNHSGGSTEVTVNHRMVGNGLVYLGTYHFKAGTSGSVEISNRSDDAGRVVIADMIRFGNGIGDTDLGGGVSGRTREDEPAVYWIKWHVDRAQGVSTSEYGGPSTTVSGPTRYSEYMNREAEGSLSDRVYISFHSNAGSGSNRGTLGLLNGNNRASAATPNQFLLANTVAGEVNDDLVAQNGLFEHNWFNRTTHTLDRSDIEFGEINNEVINGEFDATIIETAFHDNQLDAELMRDPKVRDALARSTYQGLVKYFNAVDGGATSLTMLPGQVPQVQAETVADGSVQVTWEPPASNSYNGDAPTGYMIYGSTNGYGFDGGTFVPAGTTSHVLTGLDTGAGPYYFKVAAVNEGGEGAASEVVAASPATAATRLLVVNGFDRLERSQNPLQSAAGGLVERVRPRSSNSFDYVVQVAAAIDASGYNVEIATASNELVADGTVDLADYDSVVWILGEESTVDATFNAAEQGAVTSYLAGGGKLFATGAEIGWDLDAQGNGAGFYNNVLHADYVADDANSYTASGVAGSIFDGIALQFDDGDLFYDVNFPDVLSPANGSTAALTYGSGGVAGLQYAGGVGEKVVLFGFPFETITDENARTAVMSSVLAYFDADFTFEGAEIIIDDSFGSPAYQETGTWNTASGSGFDGTNYRFAPAGSAATASWNFFVPAESTGEVFVYYRSAGNRATNVAYSVDTGAGVESASTNQTLNDDQWVSLGTYSFAPGAASVTLDAAASSGGSVVIADAVRVVLSPVTEETGDFNNDGSVTGFDFLAWQRGFGTGSGATLADGDGNGDGDVDGDDLAVWQTQYGNVSANEATAVATLTVAASTAELNADAPASYWLALPEAPQAHVPTARGGAAAAAVAHQRELQFAPPRRGSQPDPSSARHGDPGGPHDAAAPGSSAVDEALSEWPWGRRLGRAVTPLF
ncbi:MAG: hypothetical protein CMJ58_19010 [Planctomycetaceae bacterium]|nr:hypothetical protein [Planctomycetaceae bacterium]